MKEIIAYEAFDGKIFTNNVMDCINYEWENFVYPFIKEHIKLVINKNRKEIHQGFSLPVTFFDELEEIVWKDEYDVWGFIIILFNSRELRTLKLDCDIPEDIYGFIKDNCGVNIPNKAGYYTYNSGEWELCENH